MDKAKCIYCIDTSAFLDGWVRHYPPDIFETLWVKLDELVKSNNIIASIEVLHELKKKDDDIYNWCKERLNLFQDIDNDVQEKVAYIMEKYPRLVDTKKGKSGGDPFVIALSIVKSPKLTIVTGEKGGSEISPKIPYVCQQENIRCINILDLIKEQKWVF
jgi:hypothetical protein